MNEYQNRTIIEYHYRTRSHGSVIVLNVSHSTVKPSVITLMGYWDANLSFPLLTDALGNKNNLYYFVGAQDRIS